MSHPSRVSPRLGPASRSRRRRHYAFLLAELEPRLLLEGVTFVHPGILSTSTDFTRMAGKVATNANPWLADWNNLRAAGYAQLGASPRPLQTVVRGSTGSNYAQMYIDIQRAFDTALEWKVSGDTRYADQTVTFLNAWASTNTSVTGDTNAALAWGLYGFQWANIAETMKTYSGWAAADQTQFQNYLLNVYLPGNQNFLSGHFGTDPTHYWANWDLCNMASEMAIGIFCDRHDLYQAALNYVYNGIGNGAFDKAIYYIHPGNLGQGQEAGRDQGHANLDFAMLGQICQMAWNQGDDLFSYKNNAVLAGVEYLAKYNLFNDVPFVNYSSQTGGFETAISSGARGQLRPIFELFYNHYVITQGLSAPYTTQALMQYTRPEGDNGNGDEYSWGTLLFALDPDATLHAPQSLVGYQKGTGNIQLSWWGGANDASFNVYRATSAAGPYSLIASGILPTSTTYADRNLPAGTYYYKVTGVSGATETAATNVLQATTGTPLVSQLAFNESSGTTASDSVGNLTGTLNGGASFVPGKSGNAVALNGTTGYVSLPAGAIANTADFTIATWVYLSGAPTTWARIFDFGDSRGDWMFLTAKNGSGLLEFATSTTYGWVKETVTAPALATNQWVHVAVTFSNRLATLYVNGVAVASNPNMDFEPYQITGGMPNSWIGRSQYAADPYLNGSIDDFRIYSGALTAGQLYTLATGNAAPAVPAAPATFTAAAVPGNQINLNWSPVPGATSYSLYRAPTSGGPYVPIVALYTGTSYSDTGLTADTAYYYVVTAANNGGESPSSTEASATALPNLPAAVTDLTAGSSTSTSVVLNWSAATNAYSYTIKRATTSGGPYTTVATGVTALTYLDTGRTAGTTYYYVVDTVNTAGTAADSNEAYATPSDLFEQLKFDESTGTTAPDVSGNSRDGTLVNSPAWTTGKINGALSFDGVSNYVSLPTGLLSTLSTLTISVWVNPATFSTWQRIFDFGSGTGTYMFLTTQYTATGKPRFGIRLNSGTEQDINSSASLSLNTWANIALTLNGSVGILYINGVEVGRNSSMTLNPASLGATTQNWLGRSQWSADPYLNGKLDDFRIYSRALSASELSALATGARPATPNPSITLVNGNQANLSWPATGNTTGYNILRSLTPGGPYSTIAARITSTSYQDKNLPVNPATGTPYYYVVTASNLAGDSAFSSELSVTALPPAPDAVTDLSATPGTTGQILLSWSAAANAGSYTLLRSTSLNGTYSPIATGITATSYTDTSVSDNTTYYYLLTTVNATATSDTSNGDSATATDLYLRYKFDEASGTAANDASGHGSTGSLVNAPTLNSPGKLNTAVSFNGSNQYAAMPTGILSNLTTLTLSTWVYLNTLTTNSRIFDFGNNTTLYMFLSPKSGTNPRFAITTSSNAGEQNINGNAPLPTNTWVHVAVVLNGSVGTLYVNGVQVGQNTAMTLTPASLGSTTQNWIGRSQWAADPYLNGRIDDFRIYSRALSAAEVSALSQLTPPTITNLNDAGPGSLRAALAEANNLGGSRTLTFATGLTGTLTPTAPLPPIGASLLLTASSPILLAGATPLLTLSPTSTLQLRNLTLSPTLLDTSLSSPTSVVGLYDNSDLGLSSYKGQTLLSSSLLVTYAAPGDTNLDGNVDLADYDRWFLHVGGTGNANSRGDLNLDGNVDLADYDLWFTHVGITAAPLLTTTTPTATLASSATAPLSATASTSSPSTAPAPTPVVTSDLTLAPTSTSAPVRHPSVKLTLAPLPTAPRHPSLGTGASARFFAVGCDGDPCLSADTRVRELLNNL